MKNERGSVTLFVLISMIFFLVIVTTAYVSASNKLQGQIEEVELIKSAYEQDIDSDSLLQLYNKVTKTREWLQGSGTQEDTCKIYKIEDLVTFSIKSNGGDNFAGKYVELMNDLDFKQDNSYAKPNRTDFGDINGDGTVDTLKIELTTGTGFPCISATSDNAFSGTFLGDDHEIRNLFISNNTEKNAQISFFSYVENSTIQDLIITGNLKATQSTSMGGIVAQIITNKTSNLINCYNKTNIISTVGSYSIGGLCGEVAGTLNATNCHNEGSIIGSNNAGGIAGYTNGRINLENCYNTGEIINNAGDHAGGLIGRDNTASNTITINKSYNNGTVQGKVRMGGLIGYTYGTVTITDSHNSGNIINPVENVTKTCYIGGISGHLNNATLKNVYNTGNMDNKVTHTSVQIYGGGIVAVINNGEISNCYNTGKILSATRAGGLVGHASGTNSSESNLKIINSYNTGDIDLSKMNSSIVTVSNGIGRAGGIVVYPNNIRLDIINCFNSGDISTVSFCGGITGSTTGSIINIINSYNIGDLTSATSAYGICGINNSGSTLKIENIYNAGDLNGSSIYGISQTRKYEREYFRDYKCLL